MKTNGLEIEVGLHLYYYGISFTFDFIKEIPDVTAEK